MIKDCQLTKLIVELQDNYGHSRLNIRKLSYRARKRIVERVASYLTKQCRISGNLGRGIEAFLANRTFSDGLGEKGRKIFARVK